jgi:ankyrin repeat protein
LIICLLESEAKVSSSSQAMMASKGSSGYSQRVLKQMTGLHLVAYFGLKEATIALLKNEHNLHTKDTYRQTPLLWVTKSRHKAVVKLLLEKGTELETKDKDG